MQSKKAVGGLLAMGLLVALATMALVFTNWEQRLQINGNVTTGSVDVNAVRFCDLTGADCAWDNEGPGAKVTKEIASCVHTQPSAKKFVVTIENGYPGFKCHVWINITSKTKLPVVVSNRIAISPDDGSIKVTQVADTGAWDPTAHGYPALPPLTDPVTGAPIPNTPPKGDCKEAQLTGPNETTFCDFDIEVNKTAAQGTKYTFTIDVTAELLNK